MKHITAYWKSALHRSLMTIHETSPNGSISRLGSALLPMATDEDVHERYFTSLL